MQCCVDLVQCAQLAGELLTDMQTGSVTVSLRLADKAAALVHSLDSLQEEADRLCDMWQQLDRMKRQAAENDYVFSSPAAWRQ